MSIILEILAATLLVTGGAIVAFAALGVARFPDPFTRMHAATKAGVIGSGLVLLGAGLALGTIGAVLTALFGIAFLIATTPVASHVLGRAAYVAGAPITPLTASDALAGILERKVFDIDPARTARRRRARALSREGAYMPAVSIRDHAPAHRSADPVALRRIVCWLVGGEAQSEAIAQAIEIAQSSSARLTGLSAMDPQAKAYYGPTPIGGSYWSRWLDERGRARRREEAARAVRRFEEATRDTALDVVGRHEEGDPASLVLVMSGHDLAIVPAGATFDGSRASLEGEVAWTLARHRVAPVLRVRQRSRGVRIVLLIVGEDPACGRLAHGFLRSGLWPDAAITILPVASDRPGVRMIVEEQAELLRAHARAVSIMPPIDLDFEPEELARRIKGFDAAVMTCPGSRSGWFGATRTDPCEIVAESVPLTLLS